MTNVQFSATYDTASLADNPPVIPQYRFYLLITAFALGSRPPRIQKAAYNRRVI